MAKEITEKQHKNLLKAFETFRKVELKEFRSYLASPRRIFWSNFLAGTARGLGFLLGAALVIAAAGYILKEILSNFPFIGDLALAINTWIQETISGIPVKK